MGHRELWEVLAAEAVYDYPPYLKVEKQTVLLPDGRRVEDYHRLFMPSSCVICTLTDANELVLLRGYKHGLGRIGLSIPGGFIELNEDPLTSAKRELIEETGYSAEEWQFLGEFVSHGNYGGGRVYVFVAKKARKKQNPNSGDLESTEVEVMKMERVQESIRNGEISSLSSVAAIGLATQHLGLASQTTPQSF